ncbi:unnamed protein product [Rotaria sp. Silwood1]|nr:unnamed protein product [Rotaria sp. Silwood1]CAF1690704.1 unnamed protein product [Rotaria sp. Silwood1]
MNLHQQPVARIQLKKYFVFSLIEHNRISGHCQLCNQDYKDKVGIFSNFIKHLKRKHLPEYERTFNKQDEGLLEEEIIEGDGRPTTELSTNKFKQTRINLAIAKHLIIRCNFPLNLVENHAFRDFIKDCNVKWTPISAKHLKHNTIAPFKEKVNTIIHDALSAVDHVTLTVDGWTDRKCRSFLGVTCHFINFKMEPESYLIDFVRLKSPHTGENILQTTESILDRFQIKEKVYKVVTDNAASMIKAYKFGLAVDDEINDNSRETQLLSKTNAILNDSYGKFFTFI